MAERDAFYWELLSIAALEWPLLSPLYRSGATGSRLSGNGLISTRGPASAGAGLDSVAATFPGSIKGQIRALDHHAALLALSPKCWRSGRLLKSMPLILLTTWRMMCVLTFGVLAFFVFWFFGLFVCSLFGGVFYSSVCSDWPGRIRIFRGPTVTMPPRASSPPYRSNASIAEAP